MEWNNPTQRRPRFAANVLAALRRPDGGLVYRVIANIGNSQWAMSDGVALPAEWVVEHWANFDFAPGDSRSLQRIVPCVPPKPYVGLELECRLRVAPIDVELLREAMAYAATDPEPCGVVCGALLENPHTRKAVRRWATTVGIASINGTLNAERSRWLYGWRFQKAMLDWLIEQPEVREL